MRPPPSWDALPDIRLGFLDHAISLSLSQTLHSSLTCGRKVELTEWSAVFQISPKFQITGTVAIVTHYSTTFCGQPADSFTLLALCPDKNCYSTLLNRPLCLTVWILLVCWAWEVFSMDVLEVTLLWCFNLAYLRNYFRKMGRNKISKWICLI